MKKQIYKVYFTVTAIENGKRKAIMHRLDLGEHETIDADLFNELERKAWRGCEERFKKTEKTGRLHAHKYSDINDIITVSILPDYEQICLRQGD